MAASAAAPAYDDNCYVWTGEERLSSDWSYFTIPAANFVDIEEGEVLRVEYKDWTLVPSVSIVDGKWGAISGYSSQTANQRVAEYDLTAEAVAAFQSKGMIVGGKNCTVTRLRIYDPQSVVDLSPSVSTANNWTFVDTKPYVEITASNPTDEAITTEANVLVRSDKFEYLTTATKSVTIAPGATETFTVQFDAQPNVYNCSVMLGWQLVRTFNIMVEPEKIVSEPDMQSDFERFWADALAELAAVEPQFTMTELPEKSTAARKVYLVEMKSLADNSGEPATIRGYYAEPTGLDNFPVYINYASYDGGTGTPYCPDGDHIKDFAEFYTSIRGQLVNNRDPYTNPYGEWFLYGLGSEDTYYYRQAYMDVVRFIDFIASRPGVNPNSIFASGMSQGGALSYAAAALDSRINSIAVACPFLGDFPDYFTINSWPGSKIMAEAATLGLSEEEMYRVLSYVDTKNMATMVTCPVMHTIGLQDTTCPPHTTIAPYNNLPETVEKSYTTTATLGHAEPEGWSTKVMEFFRSHIEPVSGVETVGADAEAVSTGYYTIDGRAVAQPSAAGLYIKVERLSDGGRRVSKTVVK